jgi:hypothetical protein
MYRSHADDMRPVSLVVGCQQELTFPHCSLAVVGDKLCTDPRIRWPSCCGLCRVPFFSGAVDLFKSVDDCMKVAICGPREIRMVVDHTWTERGKRVACWLGFHLLVCDSNRLFVAVFS